MDFLYNNTLSLTPFHSLPRRSLLPPLPSSDDAISFTVRCQSWRQAPPFRFTTFSYHGLKTAPLLFVDLTSVFSSRMYCFYLESTVFRINNLYNPVPKSTSCLCLSRVKDFTTVRNNSAYDIVTCFAKSIVILAKIRLLFAEGVLPKGIPLQKMYCCIHDITLVVYL